MASLTMTPYKLYYLTGHTVYQFLFSNKSTSDVNKNGSWLWDSVSYVGWNSGASTKYETDYSAVCVEYNIASGQKTLNSVTCPCSVDFYSGEGFAARLSTEAPGTGTDGANTKWRFGPTTSFQTQNFGSSTSSITFSSLNATINTSKLYLYLSAPYFGGTSYVTAKASSNNYYFGNATVNYTPSTYTIAYNANGHGTAPSSQTKTHGTNLTLQSFINDVTSGGTAASGTITGNANGGSWSGSNGSASWITAKTTYHQTYWNTNSSGTGTNYSSGGTYTANAAATLYAIWSSSTVAAAGTAYTLPTGEPTKSDTTTDNFTITFNANGGNTSKSSASSHKTVSYTFKGWYTAATGGTQRTADSRVTAAETVYAQYNSSTSDQPAITLPTGKECIKINCILLGWSTSATSTTADYSPGDSYIPTETTTLYAVWGDADFEYIRISDGTNWLKYSPYIYDGTTWVRYDAYIYDGTEWKVCGDDPWATFVTSDGKTFMTSDGKVFKVWAPDLIE